MLLALVMFLGCGGADCASGGACAVADGEYYVMEPDGLKGNDPVPMVVFFHGHGSSAEDVMDKAQVLDLLDAGWLVVLPQGVGNSWSNVGSPHADRDEIPFVAEILDDVSKRYTVSSVVMSGFSQGSSMAWDAACYLPDRTDALMGASGTFWVPEPTVCDGPVPVRHTHGTSDNTMPLEGRSIGSASQGNVYVGIDAWLTTNGCAEEPDEVVESGPETCSVWSSCSSGAGVQLCLFDGGHRAPAGWSSRMLSWFDEKDAR